MKSCSERRTAVDTVDIGGVDDGWILLRTGMKFYRSAIEMYMLDKVLARAERALEQQPASTTASAWPRGQGAVAEFDWIDVGGQMMRRRLDDLCAAIAGGTVSDLDGINAELDAILRSYAEDEWIWVQGHTRACLSAEPRRLGMEDMPGIADEGEVELGRSS